MSKLLSGNIFVLTQGFLLIIYTLIGGGVRFIVNNGSLMGDTSMMSELTDSLMNTGILDKLSSVLPLTLILMIVTFVAYSLLAGILASITTNMEDFQQMQTGMKHCPQCGVELDADAMFCGECGFRF
jgi:ABC-type Na+ efflux pump permease subunit